MRLISNSSLTVKDYLAVLVFIITLLLFISPDSYLDDLFGKYDEATFFMAGKAWMNGMVPYVDFSDSKGPLLWLIYGIGYLLSPHNYIGVFWIECIWFFFIYLYVYKIANFFLDDKSKSLLAMTLMTVVFFNPWLRHEIRAEDFCQLFIVASMYHTVKLLWGTNTEDKETLTTAWVIGFCMAATTLIKFTNGAMIGIFALFVVYDIIRKRKYLLLKSILAFLCGFLLVAVPFLIVFSIQGCLPDFFNEYFLASRSTLHSSSTTFHAYVMDWIQMFIDPARLLIFGSSMLGCYLIGRKQSAYPRFLCMSLFWFLLIANFHNMLYYYEACFAFSVFLFINVVGIVRQRKTHCNISLLGGGNGFDFPLLRVRQLSLW